MKASNILPVLALAFTAMLVQSARPLDAAVVWDGPTITFTKPDFADWTQPANQDRITDNVWITRKDTQGIFNIKTEAGYSGISPADTEWADGHAADWQSLTFTSWISWAGHNPPSKVGVDAVVHLISDDIYLDLKFLSFTSGRAGGGGGFSYERSTAPVPEPATLAWVGAMVSVMARRRRPVAGGNRA